MTNVALFRTLYWLLNDGADIFMAQDTGKTDDAK